VLLLELVDHVVKAFDLRVVLDLVNDVCSPYTFVLQLQNVFKHELIIQISQGKDYIKKPSIKIDIQNLGFKSYNLF
jgi:hypothetical protein